MKAAPASVEQPCGPEDWLTGFAAPDVDLDPVPSAELETIFRGGEAEADFWERVLASAARVRGALDVALAEGLAALRQGDRLARLACHLDDYAREVLDLGKRAADGLVALGSALRTRPLLREALRDGRISLRAAETILPVAVGEGEAEWVERAADSTVRELEAAVRRARSGEADPDDDRVRFGVQLAPGDRLIVDAGLALAGEVMPGSSRIEQLEAMAQEALGTRPGGEDDPARLDPAFREIGPVVLGDERRRAVLEREMERWAALAPIPELSVPEVRWYETATASALDRQLRALARLRARWDEIVGHFACLLKQTRLHARLGFATFRHYVEERLRLPPRAVEQRVAVEARLWRSPALQEARRQKLSFERLRILARLPEGEIAGWIARAKALTCVALRRIVDEAKERQLRARHRLSVSVPRRVAAVLTLALEAVRRATGLVLPTGKCLTLLALHFLRVWRPLVRRSRTRSRQVRERDEGQCQAPGCSHRAAHAHHVLYRSQRGGDELENQIALCGFHHLRCIHGGWLRAHGRAPDALTWFRAGEPWPGPGLEGWRPDEQVIGVGPVR